MSAVLLKTTPGATITPETIIDDALLNQLANPQVEIPENAGIGPSQLDMASIGASLGVGATGSNLMLSGDFYPTGWREASVIAPAGVRTENARAFWVKPSGASITYARQQTAPDTLSAWSAYLGGNIGLSALECGTYLGPDATAKLNEVPFVVSISIKNQGNAPFRPTLEIRTSNLLQDEDAVTMRVNDQAADQVTVGSWKRYTWTLNSTGLVNWLNGAQIVFKLEPFLTTSYSILISQIDIRRGTAAAAFSVAPRENIAAGSVPSGTLLPLAGNQSVPDTGFLFCNGAAVSRSTYGNLFAKTGTLYGIGNGTSTFNLPDLRERSLVGASSMGSLQVGARALIEVAACSISSGSQILTLGTATDIPVGSLVIATGIPAGTQVIGSDSGTTAYLSAAATATATGTLDVVFAPEGTDLRTVGAVTPAGLSNFEPRFGVGNVFSRLGTGSNGSQSLRVNVSGLGYSTVDLVCGMLVEGQGIPPGTIIEAFENIDDVYLSQALTAALNLDPVVFVEPGATAAERKRWRERAALEPKINDCRTTNNSTTVHIGGTDPLDRLTRLLRQGMTVSGSGIPANTTITSISNSRTFLISNPATATANGLQFAFSYPAEYLSERIFPNQMNCLWQIKT
jgi:microcystin-dependent protein